MKTVRKKGAVVSDSARKRVGEPGLEPGTSVLSGLRSNQLSYTPMPRNYTKVEGGFQPGIGGQGSGVGDWNS